jgi:hypothetical protein
VQSGRSPDDEEVPVLRSGDEQPPAKGRRTYRKLSPSFGDATYLAYLKKLHELKDHAGARKALGLDRFPLEKFRKRREFRLEEEKALGFMPTESKQREYLYWLKKYCGNHVKAIRQAKANLGHLKEWRQIEWFIAAENEVFEWIVADATEQTVRAALGKKTRLKDTKHNQWFLAHVDKEKWGEQTKTIEHKYSGTVAVEKLDSEIALLLESK